MHILYYKLKVLAQLLDRKNSMEIQENIMYKLTVVDK